MEKVAKVRSTVSRQEDSEPTLFAEGDVKPIEPQKIYKDVFAVDIGYGYTKVKTSTIEDMIPSLVTMPAYCEEINVPDVAQAITSCLTIEHNDAIYYVGNSASKYNRQVERSTFKERSLDEDFPILFKAAIVAAYHDHESVELYVVTGLPNNSVALHEKPLREMIENISEVKFMLNGALKTIKVNIAAVHINSQPEGFFVDLMLEQSLEKSEFFNSLRRFAIADFGHYTLDYSLFADCKLLDLGGRTNSADGVFSMYPAVGKVLRDNFPKFDPSHLDIENAIVKGIVRIRSVEHDVKDLVDPVKLQYAQNSFKVLYDKWQRELDELDAIYIEGGGGAMVADEIARLFAEKANYENVFIAKAPQLLNVRGYYKLGRLSFGSFSE